MKRYRYSFIATHRWRQAAATPTDNHRGHRHYPMADQHPIGIKNSTVVTSTHCPLRSASTRMRTLLMPT